MVLIQPLAALACKFFLLSDSNLLPQKLGTTGYHPGRGGELEAKAATSGGTTHIVRWVSTALFQDIRISSLGLNLFIEMGRREKSEKQQELE